jgi:hypothetical protein
MNCLQRRPANARGLDLRGVTHIIVSFLCWNEHFIKTGCKLSTTVGLRRLSAGTDVIGVFAGYRKRVQRRHELCDCRLGQTLLLSWRFL